MSSETSSEHAGQVNGPDSGLTDSLPDAKPVARGIKQDPVSDVTPHMAPVEALWSRRIRTIAVIVIAAVVIGYVLFGTILARNVTFNMSQNIDPGRTTGIRRFSRESIVDVWQTIWDKAPDFGSIDLTRGILAVSTVAFFAAFALIIALIFVPSRQEWAAGLVEGQESDTISGD